MKDSTKKHIKENYKPFLFMVAFAALLFFLINGMREEQCKIGLHQYQTLVQACEANASCPKDMAYLRARAEAVRSIGYCRPQ